MFKLFLGFSIITVICLGQNLNHPFRQMKGMNVAAPTATSTSTTSRYSVATNFAVDLYGSPDESWGYDDYVIWPLTFIFVPSGYSVNITSLQGDVIAWIKTLPGDAKTPAESTAGILGGIQTTSGMNGSNANPCTFCALGTPVYVQDSVTEKQPKTRTPFNYTNLQIVLDSDNTLHFKVASFLNTTGKPIHMEITCVIQFTYVR